MGRGHRPGIIYIYIYILIRSVFTEGLSSEAFNSVGVRVRARGVTPLVSHPCPPAYSAQ